MGYAAIAIGIVGLLQGTAWLGGSAGGRRRRVQGAILAPLGSAMLMLGLLHLLVPEFWGRLP